MSQSHKDQPAVERVDEPLPPGILDRLRTKRGDGPTETITAFAPSAERHTEYPAVLPFVPHTAVYVTEYSDATISPGARWLAQEPEAIAEFLIADSRANGWYDAPSDNAQVRLLRSLKHAHDVTSTYLFRNGTLRTILIARVEAQSVVQLLDSPPSK